MDNISNKNNFLSLPHPKEGGNFTSNQTHDIINKIEKIQKKLDEYNYIINKFKFHTKNSNETGDKKMNQILTLINKEDVIFENIIAKSHANHRKFK